MNHDEIAEEITSLISNYHFPLEVLQDVNQRLNDCRDVHYAAQQLRYLQNIVKVGNVKKKVGAAG
ncbi:DUF6877 family protein [Lysinibacillus telephonicus]|uniref:DUF6877 family protein n=1 Tax=Lysinibacillus telephonicus TaxID=1714840 RepID=UPI0031FDDC4E